MSIRYKAAKQSILARYWGSSCCYRNFRWDIVLRGFVLGSSTTSAKDAWIDAKERFIRGRIDSAS